MLQGVGELREVVWETRGFTFRVLLIPYGPFTEVATASEAITSRKGGNGPGQVSPLVPVQSRTGTNGGIGPGS